MTEREAWLWLAPKWDDPISDSNGCCWMRFNTADCVGICACILNMYTNGMIGLDVVSSMERKIVRERHIRDTFNPPLYLFPRNRDGARQRAALCRRFAAECEVAA